MTKISLGLDDSRAARMIKKAREIGVAVKSKDEWLVTNAQWIIRVIPHMHGQALAAITAKIGLVEVGDNKGERAIGTLAVPAAMVVDLFSGLAGNEGEAAEVLPWLYEEAEGLLRIVATNSGSIYTFQDSFVSMFDETCEKKIVVDTRSGAHILASSYNGELVGIVMECQAELRELPRSA